MSAVWKKRGRRALVWALRIAAGIVTLPLLYFLAALFLGLVPANVAFRQPAEGGVLIYVRSNGVHTDLVMPKGYTAADTFYEGDGSFSMFFNCNAWTGAALRAGGVRMGLWTPFEQSVMSRLD